MIFLGSLKTESTLAEPNSLKVGGRSTQEAATLGGRGANEPINIFLVIFDIIKQGRTRNQYCLLI